MKQIKKFKKHRWFIWAVVVSFAGLGFLATYIYSISVRDESEIPVIFGLPKNVVKSKVSVSLPVTQIQSVFLVKNIPDVQAYLKVHPKARVTPDEQIGAGTQNPYWPVHVYEDFKDHAKTFGWYKVYAESGVIIKQ
jgi:hypothetical protein